MDHRSVIRRHNVAESQAMNVHHRPPDLLQVRLTGHILIHNGPSIGVDIIDAEYRQNVGQESYQPQ